MYQKKFKKKKDGRNDLQRVVRLNKLASSLQISSKKFTISLLLQETKMEMPLFLMGDRELLNYSSSLLRQEGCHFLFNIGVRKNYKTICVSEKLKMGIMIYKGWLGPIDMHLLHKSPLKLPLSLFYYKQPRWRCLFS